MGVTVTFVAMLELLREGLIEIVQTEPMRRCTCAGRSQRVHCSWCPTPAEAGMTAYG